MSLRRFGTLAARLLVVAAAVLIVPACKKKTDDSLTILARTPDPNAVGVSHFPLMAFEWNKDLDPATVNNTNIKIYTTDGSGVPVAPWGNPYSVEYIPGTRQVIVKNAVALGNATTATEYAVMIFPGLTDDKGNPLVVPVTGGLALLFFVGTNANLLQPSFNAPAQDGASGTSGQIVWTWTQAQENAANIAATYVFYRSSATGGQDFLETSPFSSGSATGATMSGLTPNTQYFFRVLCRDASGNIFIVPTPEITATSRP